MCLIPVVVALYVGAPISKTGATHTPAWNAFLLFGGALKNLFLKRVLRCWYMVGMAFSRIGLWIFDLTQLQILQESLESHPRKNRLTSLQYILQVCEHRLVTKLWVVTDLGLSEHIWHDKIRSDYGTSSPFRISLGRARQCYCSICRGCVVHISVRLDGSGSHCSALALVGKIQDNVDLPRGPSQQRRLDIAFNFLHVLPHIPFRSMKETSSDGEEFRLHVDCPFLFKGLESKMEIWKTLKCRDLLYFYG